MKKKKLIIENEELKKSLEFFIMVTELNKVKIPEQLYERYACRRNELGFLVELFPRSEFKKWGTSPEHHLLNYSVEENHDKRVDIGPNLEKVLKRHTFLDRGFKDESEYLSAIYTQGLVSLLNELREVAPRIGLGVFIRDTVIPAWKYGYKNVRNDLW